jgi:predicted nucleic acid-binding protein
VKAEDIYVDPSALTRLYIHEDGSREMAAWRARTGGGLSVTHHGRTEIINAICRAAFHSLIDVRGLAEALDEFETDFAEGRLLQADLLWRAALNRAAELSKAFTTTLGTRSLDVLHVACAIELKHSHFLTFDARQRKLAKAAGLKAIAL